MKIKKTVTIVIVLAIKSVLLIGLTLIITALTALTLITVDLLRILRWKSQKVIAQTALSNNKYISIATNTSNNKYISIAANTSNNSNTVNTSNTISYNYLLQCEVNTRILQQSIQVYNISCLKEKLTFELCFIGVNRSFSSAFVSSAINLVSSLGSIISVHVYTEINGE